MDGTPRNTTALHGCSCARGSFHVHTDLQTCKRDNCAVRRFGRCEYYEYPLVIETLSAVASSSRRTARDHTLDGDAKRVRHTLGLY